MQLLKKRRMMTRLKPHIRELADLVEAILLQETQDLIGTIEAYEVVVGRGFSLEQLRQILASIQRTDLPPMTRPVGVRVGLVPRRQSEASSLSCCAGDGDYTPAAIVQ